MALKNSTLFNKPFIYAFFLISLSINILAQEDKICIKELSIENINFDSVVLNKITETSSAENYFKQIHPLNRFFFYGSIHPKRKTSFQVKKITLRTKYKDHPEYSSQIIEFEYCTFFYDPYKWYVSKIFFIRMCKSVTTSNIDHQGKAILPNMTYDHSSYNKFELKIETEQNILYDIEIPLSLLDGTLDNNCQ